MSVDTIQHSLLARKGSSGGESKYSILNTIGCSEGIVETFDSETVQQRVTAGTAVVAPTLPRQILNFLTFQQSPQA